MLLLLWLCFGQPKSPSVPIQAQGDLNGNGIPEKYVLIDQTLLVIEGKQEIWQSPQGYRVESFALADVDNDGQLNIVISLWKKGSFGKLRPFWHKGENDEYKNHLFVYKLQNHTIKAVWCSSNLDRPILAFDVRDVDGDGLNELVVKEGHYKKIWGQKYTVDEEKPARITVWQWQQWGFYLEEP
ncbi:VCBS repeat-containing protein [Aminipila butyrica]|uniref:VCBS repeat-containing protein n=1 Tax=Aminipila butyrica TaxID=433296 RepID=A0A858C0F1_9FIRM|nr:VCBS repeat-containing protein [Aminipila butyrica]